MNWFLAITTVSLVVLSHHGVDAIHCYTCDNSNSGCSSSDPTLLAPYRTDCAELSGTEAVDYKVMERCAKIYASGEITRTCYNVEPAIENTCKTVQGTTACVCSGDDCNGGSIHHRMTL